MAWFGHSGSHTSQLMHSSVISKAMRFFERQSVGAQAAQARQDDRIDERGYVTAEQRNLAHDRSGDEHVLLAGGEKHRLHVGIEVAVHARHLKFVFKV